MIELKEEGSPAERVLMGLNMEELEKIVKRLEVPAVPIKVVDVIDVSIKLNKPNFLREEFIRLRIEIAEVPGKRYTASLIPQPFTCLTELSTDHALFSWAKEEFTVASSDPYLAFEELLHRVEKSLREIGLIP